MIDWWKGNGGWWVQFPYSRSLISEIKRKISRRHRRWSKENSAWWFSDKTAEIAGELLFEEFGNHNGPGSVMSKFCEHHSTLHLQHGAPMEVVKAAHKALSLLHHPDLGGSNERMKQINNAYDEIVKTLKDLR